MAKKKSKAAKARVVSTSDKAKSVKAATHIKVVGKKVAGSKKRAGFSPFSNKIVFRIKPPSGRARAVVVTAEVDEAEEPIFTRSTGPRVKE